MNRFLSIIILWLAALNLSAQSNSTNMNINITVNNSKVLEATLVDNSSTRALVERLQQGSISYTSSPYGNFESVGDIGFTLPRNDTQITTSAGDIILYQGRNICLYYDTNSWNFTRLGRITNATQSELRSLLSVGNVTITLSLASSTGISESKTENQNAQSKKGIFSLDGRRLEKAPTKGVYIENGVKKAKMQ